MGRFLILGWIRGWVNQDGRINEIRKDTSKNLKNLKIQQIYIQAEERE